MQKLVDGYFSQIEVVYTDFTPQNTAECYDGAVLAIVVPKELLDKYSKMKGLESPDGAKFWKETRLAERLRRYEGTVPGEHANLLDVLEYLTSEVGVSYSETPDPTKTRILIYEL
jgi:hypothetical protein